MHSHTHVCLHTSKCAYTHAHHMRVKVEKWEKNSRWVGSKEWWEVRDQVLGEGNVRGRERQKRDGSKPGIAVETPADMLCCMLVMCIKHT